MSKQIVFVANEMVTIETMMIISDAGCTSRDDAKS